jgi:hypothetical protein
MSSKKKEPTHYPAQNETFLAGISSQVVAEIAARLPDANLSPVERVRLAFDLLDAAESGMKEVKEIGSYHSGLGMHLRYQEDFDNGTHNTIYYDPNNPFFEGGVVKFENAMKELFGRRIRKKDRATRFTGFVAHWYVTPEDQEAMEEAERRGETLELKCDAPAVVERWQKEGMPIDFFFLSFKLFPFWWENQVLKKRSAAGKASGAAKVGRVRRRMDKRKGARLEKVFLKKVKKSF